MNHAGPHPRPPRGHDEGDAARRRRAAVAGHTGDVTTAQRLTADPDPRVRATALGALVRMNGLDAGSLARAAADPDARVRRRLAEELGRHPVGPALAPSALRALTDLLADADPLTVEATAWALGELAGQDRSEATVPDRERVAASLVGAAGHEDPLVREAIVAALGAIGDPTGLATVLAATTDRPAIRRRAVLALAAFLGQPGVDDALLRAEGDRDWQVRQSAELLRRPDP